MTVHSGTVHPEQWYADQAVDLRLDTTVTALNRDQRTATVSSGEMVGYDKLLLTTGASPRRLPVPAPTPTVCSTCAASAIANTSSGRSRQPRISSSSVASGGWIGLEVAAAWDADVEVTILEAGELPLLRVMGSQIAPVFADLHREHGVDLRLGAHVTEIIGKKGAATGVRLADGTRIEADADAVVVGKYDLGTEYAGYTESDGYDDVIIRGDPTARQFLAF
ncbi:FAD-dependent oxidoreductase [Streptomyces sp. NPDC127063]|uniref:FAD-dependent oxidoreductase n=1 Tax=Streptomyces sp. NPDC127063 TaxID=3347123 RepID=UPI00365F8626